MYRWLHPVCLVETQDVMAPGLNHLVYRQPLYLLMPEHSKAINAFLILLPKGPMSIGDYWKEYHYQWCECILREPPDLPMAVFQQ